MVSTVIVSTLALRSWICATFLKTANFFTFQFLGVSFHTGAQELDKRWKISTETAIKAKSMRGYATYTR